MFLWEFDQIKKKTLSFSIVISFKIVNGRIFEFLDFIIKKNFTMI